MASELLDEVRAGAEKRTRLSQIRLTEREWENVKSLAVEAGVPAAGLLHFAVVRFLRECQGGNGRRAGVQAADDR
jgi:hypothetical protein